ncbi:MAG: adenylate/guanylate cyclase domain-containing protein [Chloroflexi bacterium]|nr:adenylate/guanylate cyclase domain-containing protein [Chloroflexota bacterium]
MEPRIQYATTSDGVSIALWSLGSGLPLVVPPPAMPWSHIEQEWQIPEWRHWYEHLIEQFRVVRYDNRGSGLSDHGVSHETYELHIRDLEAVVDRLDLQRFALFACFGAAPISIAYAARHPERVSHLVLWCGFSDGSDTRQNPEVTEALDRLMTINYGLFTETLTHTVFGWEQGDAAHSMALYMQRAMSAEEARDCWTKFEEGGVSTRLSEVEAPTLVLHRRDFPVVDVSVARRLAAGIPNARLKLVDGASLSPFGEGMRQSLDPMVEFLGADLSAAARHQHVASAPALASMTAGGFRTVMFTDLAGSTAITQRLGDSGAQEVVRFHNAIVNDALARFRGSAVKHTGDGIMASFLTASTAVECAIAIQQAFAGHNAGAPDRQVRVRIGINAGEPVFEGEDLFGTAVQLASRVCAQAEPGMILTSDVVRQLVAGKGFLFADHGATELRGFEDPVRLYEVRWQGDD